MVASGCVIAAVQLLKYSSVAFGWTLETARADEPIAKANEINEAAEQEHFAPGLQ